VDTALSDPLVGRLLDSRYRVETRIARGGMATVYTALDTRLDRVVALKVMHPALADDAGFLTRFNQEAKAAARLSHPHVVAVYDQGEDGENVFLAMEYVQGRTLRDLLRERGRLTPGQALSILEPVVAALRAAHAAGLVHRDIKPENVLLADDGRIKVADFGLARALANAEQTATGLLIGTVAYLSPEQVQHGTSDARSDVYGVGILLYEMLVGSPPYAGETAWAVASRHVNEDVPLPSTVVPSTPRELDELVRDATRRDPAQRPADASELHARVVRARAALETTEVIPAAASVTARPDVAPSNQTQVLGAPIGGPPKEPPTKERAPRRRWPIVVTGIVLLALLGAGLGYWFAVGRSVTVPSVLTMTEAAAKTKLENAGFEVRTGEPVFSAAVPKNNVAQQDPGAGEHVDKGDTVTLHLSQGPEVYDVPDLKGKTVDAATRQLGELKLEVGLIDHEYSSTVKEGRIISTSPPAGTELNPGDSVRLIVSKGPQPIGVPNVVGKQVEDARTVLESVGLKAQVNEVYSDDKPIGEVLAQNPANGTADKGSAVVLSVSKGPHLYPVPNVEGMKYDDAIAALQNAGFEASVSDIPGGPNRVLNQSPDPGSEERKGTTVTIYGF
jgi:serine/threonine-protein kinase